MSDPATVFEPHRRFLVGVAYRMLGSVAEAEDVVQDAYLRWEGVAIEERAQIIEPRAYLARVVTRLCLDRMKSARATRETYVGTWLPEPIVEGPGPSEIADDLSVALLMTLERLSPLERAAFLLHDVFDMDYSAIAGVLERSEAACRQLATRAREHVRDERPRFEPSREAEARLTAAFAAAMMSGDTGALTHLLAEDAVFYSDGGGKRRAALHPIYGRDKIVRFFIGIQRKSAVPESADPVRINGLPGFVLHVADGVETISLETSGEQIVAIYAIRNPDKLRHLS
ncbi:sigma-70 family RNA polymerase sigma factor [soil metagenome]